MNTIVALPIVATVPTIAPAMPADDRSPAAVLARAVEIVTHLRTSYIREGWKLDEVAAERALDSLRRYKPAAEDEDDPEDFREAMDFFHSHGQSLDWIFFGDPNSMICMLAARSERANNLADAELIKLADQYIAAEQEYCDLNRLVDKMEGDGRPRGYKKAARAMETAERRYRQLERRIEDLRATTSEGMKAKIRCALAYEKIDEIDEIIEIEGGGCPEAMAISIFNDIVQLPQPLYLPAPAVQVDPIFAAIEEHRQAYAAVLGHDAEEDDGKFEPIGDREMAAANSWQRQCRARCMAFLRS